MKLRTFSQGAGYALTLGALILAVMTLVIFVGEGIDAYYRSRLPDMVHGTAHRPYVTRTLVPLVARAGTAVLPAGARDALVGSFERWTWRPETWMTEHAPAYVFVVLVMAVSLAGFAAGIRRLARQTLGAPDHVGAAAALVALACLPVFFGPFSRQIYDFTTLWLFTLGLAFMIESRWTAYAVLFPIASLNKETSILLTLVFVFHYLRERHWMPWPVFMRLLTYQVVAFVLVRGVVAYVFKDNPGGVVEVHLFGHNQLVLLNPELMSKRLPLLVAAALVGAWPWWEKPAFLRSALLVLAPVLLVMGVTVGQIDEIRAYYEIYPVVVLLVTATACRVLGVPLGASEGPRPTAVTARAG